MQFTQFKTILVNSSKFSILNCEYKNPNLGDSDRKKKEKSNRYLSPHPNTQKEKKRKPLDMSTTSDMMEDTNMEDDELASMSIEDIQRQSRLLDNEIRVFKVLFIYY